MSRSLGSAVLLVCLVACGSPTPRPPLAQIPYEAPLVPFRAMPGEPDDAALEEVRLRSVSCGDAERERRELADAAVAEMRDAVDGNYAVWKESAGAKCTPLGARGHMWGDTIGESFGAGGLGLSGAGEGGGGAGSASKTNNQVAGVDEADLVKHDGKFLYVATGQSLRIVQANAPKLISTTKLPGAVRQLFVAHDRVVAYVAVGSPWHSPCTYAYDCTVAGDGTSTKILVLDVSDRGHPRIARELQLSGSLIAARRIDDAVHTVVADQESGRPLYASAPPATPWCGVSAKRRADERSKWEKLKADNEVSIRAATVAFPTVTEAGTTTSLCSSLSARAGGKSFTTLLSFDLLADQQKPVTATVHGKPGVVFASERSLYMAVQQTDPNGHAPYSFYEAAKEVSDIHAFHIGSDIHQTRYVGSGAVPGHVINQFAMDEREGVLRIATTQGRVPDPEVESAVSSFVESKHGNLLRIGAVEHIARGEDIRAVRFDDDRGYVVTFKKTDPLFVLDLRAPTRPVVLGELKIPGFSTYLHRIDPNHLLSIGFDADDHGDFAYFDGLLLQLFDVHDPLAPKLIHRARLGSRGSSSQAAGDHLAFNYMPERNLLAIPATLCEGGDDGRFGTKLAFSGLLVFEASVAKGFQRLGGVDHGKAGASCRTWWSNPTSQVQRSVVMDDLIYSIAPDRMQVQNLKRLGSTVADIALGD